MIKETYSVFPKDSEVVCPSVIPAVLQILTSYVTKIYEKLKTHDKDEAYLDIPVYHR